MKKHNYACRDLKSQMCCSHSETVATERQKMLELDGADKNMTELDKGSFKSHQNSSIKSYMEISR